MTVATNCDSQNGWFDTRTVRQTKLGTLNDLEVDFDLIDNVRSRISHYQSAAGTGARYEESYKYDNLMCFGDLNTAALPEYDRIRSCRNA